MLIPSIMLGNMNIVEEAINRLPSHTDPAEAISALISLKSQFNIADSWCRENPTTLDFSFQMVNKLVQFRINKIYISKDLIPYS